MNRIRRDYSKIILTLLLIHHPLNHHHNYHMVISIHLIQRITILLLLLLLLLHLLHHLLSIFLLEEDNMLSLFKSILWVTWTYNVPTAMHCILFQRSFLTQAFIILTLACVVYKDKSIFLPFSDGHMLFRISLMISMTILSLKTRFASITIPWHLLLLVLI